MSKKQKPKSHQPMRSAKRMTNEEFNAHILSTTRTQIARLTKARKEYQDIRDQYGSAEPAQPYVIICDGLFVRFQEHLGAAVANAVPIEQAGRFEKNVADTLASKLTEAHKGINGNTFEVLHINDALDKVIVGHEQAVETLSLQAQSLEQSLATIH